MQKQISNKTLFYLFILLFIGLVNNKNFLEFNFTRYNNFKITSLSEFNDQKIIKNLLELKNKNLFTLKKEEILEIFSNHKIIEDFNIYKNYPSNLIIKIKKTKFLAIIQKNNSKYYVGSNGNLIRVENDLVNLPFIFGDVEVYEFLNLKSLIDNSNFNFEEIKNLYYFKSKRWDIETKDGVIVKLPRDNLIRSIKLLSDIFKKKELSNIKNIDLRQYNQIILNG